MAGPLSHSKLCEIEDFSHPDLLPVMRDVLSPFLTEHPDYPVGMEHRKSWEIVMTARAFRDFGALHAQSEVLGVGAGREVTLFWLTNHVKRVFATDLYLTEDEWSAGDSGSQIVRDPRPLWGGEWNPRRLVAQHMNGLELQYEDDSFDAVFSSSSIEHFGTFGEVRRSVEEMYRVLKPGGVLALATEYRLEGPPPGVPGTNIFSEAELRDLLLRGFDWELQGPLDLGYGDASLALELTLDDILAADEAGTPAFPAILLRLGGHLWTSVHVTLVKSGSPAPVKPGSGRRIRRRETTNKLFAQPRRIRNIPAYIRDRRSR